MYAPTLYTLTPSPGSEMCFHTLSTLLSCAEENCTLFQNRGFKRTPGWYGVIVDLGCGGASMGGGGGSGTACEGDEACGGGWSFDKDWYWVRAFGIVIWCEIGGACEVGEVGGVCDDCDGGVASEVSWNWRFFGQSVPPMFIDLLPHTTSTSPWQLTPPTALVSWIVSSTPSEYWVGCWVVEARFKLSMICSSFPLGVGSTGLQVGIGIRSWFAESETITAVHWPLPELLT